MAEILFPVQPQPIGTEYTFENRTWRWTGYSWDFVGAYYPSAYSSIMFSHGPIDPVDGSSYFFGDIPDDFPLSDVLEQAKIICPYDGEVVWYSVMIHPGSTGSGETSSFYLINETQGDSIIASFEIDHYENYLLSESIGVPVQVNAGDVLYWKWDSPIWTSNPLQVRTRIEVKIKLSTNV